MAEPTTRGYPLFPLGIVALPSEGVALHIFEQRYRTMVERCLEAEPGALERSFGIVWLAEDELKPIGCTCEVEEVLERMPDGRLNILARGIHPFRLLERQDDLPYPAGAVEFLDEDAEEPDEEAAAEARALYSELVKAATDRELTAPELLAMSAYRMAATVEFELEAKQELLELRSENARMLLLARLLHSALERLDLAERARARALSNGKVRFS